VKVDSNHKRSQKCNTIKYVTVNFITDLELTIADFKDTQLALSGITMIFFVVSILTHLHNTVKKSQLTSLKVIFSL